MDFSAQTAVAELTNMLLHVLLLIYKEADSIVSISKVFNKVVIKEISRRQAREKNTKQFFDKQIEALLSRGCPFTILETFQETKEKVVSKAIEIPKSNERLAFLLVVPREFIGVYCLSQMIGRNRKKGYTHLDPNKMWDIVDRPSSPYVVYDVEDGRKMLGISSQKAEDKIRKSGRSPLTIDEGINLCIQTDVLSHHYVDCPGTRYESDKGVPNISLLSGVPYVDWWGNMGVSPMWGAASCKFRSKAI